MKQKAGPSKATSIHPFRRTKYYRLHSSVCESTHKLQAELKIYFWILSSSSGNFTTQPPPERQLSGALALIEEIEYQRKVAPTYSILGIRCFNRSEHDGAALFAQLANWDRWDQIISIY